MTTFTPFTPSVNQNFQFPATFDNQLYNVVVTWNLFGARYYVNIYSVAGTLIVSRPLIGSTLGYVISSITANANIAVATTTVPHTFRIGTIVPLVISGATPSGYNGAFNCSILTNTQFSYQLPAELDPSSVGGSVIYNQSMTAGYFNSTFIYLPDSGMFAVNP
jgi:hypothetical protein